MLERRTFLTMAAGSLLAAPLAAWAQEARALPRLGMLLTGSPSDMRQSRELDALTKKLGELGWVAGRTLDVETRWAKDTATLPGLAAELVRLGVTNLRDRGFFAICYANSTNKTIAAPRANNWDEVYELVHAQAKKLGFPK